MHIIYVVSLNSPVALSYDDSWNKDIAGAISGEGDKLKGIGYNFSSSTAASTSISVNKKNSEKIPRIVQKVRLTTPHGILH